jgi:double-stranded uracil-DNA glycosylase
MVPVKSRPTQEEIKAAVGKTVPDIIAPGLKVLFCGINPGLYTAAIGHHFGRPGNRFWPVLYASGITPRLFSPYEERELLNLGYGITNIVSRATAAASDLSQDEIIAGGSALVEKVKIFQPDILAILGITAFRIAFNDPKATAGCQPLTIGKTQVWVLPNPSGLNAHYQVDTLAALFRSLTKESLIAGNK